jgi:hypothetical protein
MKRVCLNYWRPEVIIDGGVFGKLAIHHHNILRYGKIILKISGVIQRTAFLPGGT